MVEPPSPGSLSPVLPLQTSSRPVTPSGESEGSSPVDPRRDYFGLTSSPAVQHALSKLEGEEAETKEARAGKGRSAMELERPQKTESRPYGWF